MLTENMSAKSSATKSMRYPVFVIPKKEGTVRFIIYYRRNIHKLVRKPYPLPRIGETM